MRLPDTVILSSISMFETIYQPLLKAAFAAKGDFAPGILPPERCFDGIEIAPFPGGARAAATISADFELAWAFRGRSLEERTLRARRCRENVPYLVRILEEESIPITWATVGHLFLEKCERTSTGLAHPDMPRPRRNERWEGDWYKHDPCTCLGDDPGWYATDLIQTIRASKVKHEIGSHSFSHIDFSEATADRELVRRELEECIKVMAPSGLRLRSLVYPFNNMGHHFLDLIADLNITSVRHRDKHARLSYPERSEFGVYKLYESMPLRRGRGYYFADRAKIFMDEALDRFGAYHLWFHPSDPTEWFEYEFRSIIRHIADLRDKGILWAATMSDVAAYCEARTKTRLDVRRSGNVISINLESTYDIARYGETQLTLRVPITRLPKRSLVSTGNGFEATIGRLDTQIGLDDKVLLLAVPATATEVTLEF